MFTTNIITNYAICYSMYFIMLWIIYLNKSNQLFDKRGFPAKNSGNLLGLQIAGVLWLGLVPLIWATPILHIIFGEGHTGTIFSITFFAALIILIYTGIYQGNRPVMVSQNIILPSKSYYIRYFIVRILFLLSYELFFRGLLLFLNTEKMGLTMAIMADIILTVLLHVFNNKKIMWACIPFSIVACMLNTQAQAVWPSILLHFAISFSFELTALKKIFNLLKTSS